MSRESLEFARLYVPSGCSPTRLSHRNVGDYLRSFSRQALDLKGAADRLHAVLEADQSRPSAGVGSALAVISNHQTQPLIVHMEGHPDATRLGMLGRVRERLRHDVVRGDFDRVGEAVFALDVELDSDRRTAADAEREVRSVEFSSLPFPFSSFLEHAELRLQRAECALIRV